MSLNPLVAPPPVAVTAPPAQVHALRRIALAVADPGGPGLFAHLARELAASLDAGLVLIAEFADADKRVMRTVAACLDGRLLRPFEYPLDGTPLDASGGCGWRYAAEGVLACLPAGSIALREGMDSLAAFPFHDSAGEPLGLVIAMDRQPVARGDAEHAEAMLKIVAGRAAAEIERGRTDAALRAVALAVSGSRTGTVFDELVRLLAGILRVELAFIARFDAARPGMLTVLAMYSDGQLQKDITYPIAGTPCETVLAQRFRAYPAGLQARFPADEDARVHCTESYAGHPLSAPDGSPLGIVAIASRRPLAQVDRVEAMLKIFAVRAAAEVERLGASEALQRSLEDLRQREAQYRAIFESSVDGLFLWDEHLRIADVNPAGLALYGFRREDVIGRTFPSTLPPEYVEQRLGMVRRALAGETTHVEATVLRPGRPSFEADLRVMPFEHLGRPHALAVLRDISERRQRERELQRSEARLRATVDAAFDAVVGMDSAGLIVEFNAAAERIFGWRRVEVLGRPLADVLVPPARREAYECGMVKLREAGESPMAGRLVETTMLRADGTEIPVELALSVAVVPEGNIFVGHLRDISERRRADQALRDSEEQYRAIFNASVDALVLRDADFRIVDVNATYEAMSGNARADVLGVDQVLANPPEVRDTIRSLHGQALAGATVRLETELRRRDGGHYDLELRGVPIQHRGQPHVLYIGRDITQARRAEQRRRELERQLRQAQKMEAIGQLTGGIAHDFNNILTSVIGYIAMSQERPAAAGDAALARQLGQARLAAERARDHVAQLLAFSRPRGGDKRLVDPAQLAHQALELLRPNLSSAIAVESDDVHDPGEVAVPPVVADPVQIEQVLFNLCINARDAIHGHGTIRVRLGHSAAAGCCASCGEWLEERPWVWVEVADDGLGMAAEVMDRMFEPFFTTKEVGRGSGMGLAMVHGIVHDHDGHVQVESAPGRGSVFRVLLPVAAQEAPARQVPAATQPLAAGEPLPGGRVLLVEDEAFVGEYMRELLSGWGLDVVLERETDAALARLERATERFDLLLTDHTMPGMTGVALARHARRCRPGLAMLLYTGNASEIGAEELAASGVHEVLRKPVDPAALRALLRGLLARSGQEQRAAAAMR